MRYAWRMVTLCQVEGMPVNSTALSLRSMNFGQHWRTGPLQEVCYQVSLPIEWLVEVSSRNWEELVQDAQRFPEDDELLEFQLRALSWPTPQKAFEHIDIASLLAERFSFECLLRFLGDGPPDDSPGFVLNTIDKVTVSSMVTFAGTARPHDPQMTYRFQDV
jgi:hypothetical protein